MTARNRALLNWEEEAPPENRGRREVSISESFQSRPVVLVSQDQSDDQPPPSESPEVWGEREPSQALRRGADIHMTHFLPVVICFHRSRLRCARALGSGGVSHQKRKREHYRATSREI